MIPIQYHRLRYTVGKVGKAPHELLIMLYGESPASTFAGKWTPSFMGELEWECTGVKLVHLEIPNFAKAIKAFRGDDRIVRVTDSNRVADAAVRHFMAADPHVWRDPRVLWANPWKPEAPPQLTFPARCSILSTGTNKPQEGA